MHVRSRGNAYSFVLLSLCIGLISLMHLNWFLFGCVQLLNFFLITIKSIDRIKQQKLRGARQKRRCEAQLLNLTKMMMMLKRSTRGVLSPCLPSALNNSMALFHSRVTQLPQVSNAEDARKVFDDMFQARPRPSIISFTQILGKLIKLKQYPAVISLYKQVLLHRINPNDYTLNILIKCYSHLNKMGLSFSVFGKFFKLSIHPDVITFSTLIHGFVLHNQLPEASRIFVKMPEDGHCKPNVFTFSTLIKGFCNTGNNSASITLLRKMEEQGCQPNKVTYSTIIDSLCKETLIDEALKLFSEMISRGISPDVVTYNCLIHGLCIVGRWNEAERLLEDMLGKCIFPDVYTFNVLVGVYSKEGKVVEAEGLVQMMIERHIEPDTITYNSLMQGYCLRGEMEEARKVFDLMLSKGSMIGVRSCNILINGYCKAKKVDQADEIFKEMPRMELIPSLVTYKLQLYYRWLLRIWETTRSRKSLLRVVRL